MPDFVICPTCANPVEEGRECAFCLAKQEAETATASAAAQPAPAPKAAPATEAAPEAPYVPPMDHAFTTPDGDAPQKEAVKTLFTEDLPASKAPNAGDYRRTMEKTFAPMGAWNVFGTLLLFSLPIIGTLFAVIFACGGCRKKQKASLARGYLLLMLAAVLFSALVGGALWAIVNFFPAELSEAMNSVSVALTDLLTRIPSVGL